MPAGGRVTTLQFLHRDLRANTSVVEPRRQAKPDLQHDATTAVAQLQTLQVQAQVLQSLSQRRQMLVLQAE